MSDWKAERTFQDYTIIDQERGIVTHTKFLTNDTYTRYMRTQNRTLRPDLFRPWEKYMFWKTYYLGEKLIANKRKINLAQMSQMLRVSSFEFCLQNSYDIFAPTVAKLTEPVFQSKSPGPLRSNLERQSIVDYVTKWMKVAYDLGMVNIEGLETHDEKINRITNNLREKYMKPKAQPSSQQ